MKFRSLENFEKDLVELKLKKLITPVSSDPTDFNNACETFREVCFQIGKLLGIPEGGFRGGFDEMKLCTEYVARQDKDTPEGQKKIIQMLVAVSAWSGANSLCTYEAKKLAIGQPEWWIQCWELYDQLAPEI